MVRAEKNVCDIEEGLTGVEKTGELVNKLESIWKEISKKGYMKGEECFWCKGFKTQCHIKSGKCHSCIVGHVSQKGR